MGRITIKDVARAAGVGVATASRALNNKDDVSPETRQRVLKAAEALGYVPNLLAKGLLSGRTRTIGVVVTSILNPFYAVVVHGIEQVLSAKGYNMVLCNSDESPKKELEAVRMLIEQRVDGIILAPVEDRSLTVQYLMEKRVPFTLVARKTTEFETDYVVCDDRLVGEIATNYLIERGHRQILFLNSRGNSSSKLRLEGYHQAMKRAGIPVDAGFVYSLTTNDRIEEVVFSILDSGVKPSAIFCFCDVITLPVIRALKAKGLRIPDDIGVMGCDNLEFTEFMDPPLTTIDIGKDKMGAKAAELLLGRLIRNRKKTATVDFEPNLVIRSSV